MKDSTLVALVALVVAVLGASATLAAGTASRAPAVQPPAAPAPTTAPQLTNGPPPAATTREPEPLTVTPIRWRRSRAVGKPFAGRLVRGVQLPAAGRDFFTWDAVLRRAPDRDWRRFGTDRLVWTVLSVLADFRAAHPEAARVGVGDLSRPHGGIFDERFGGLGHGSHQNGLDVDVFYPRRDRAERPPDRPADVDRRLAQELVSRFARAGAQYVFVGPHVGLTGPPAIVQKLVHHDDHLHFRLRP